MIQPKPFQQIKLPSDGSSAGKNANSSSNSGVVNVSMKDGKQFVLKPNSNSNNQKSNNNNNYSENEKLNSLERADTEIIVSSGNVLSNKQNSKNHNNNNNANTNDEQLTQPMDDDVIFK